MTRSKFDQDFWEQLWSKTLHDHADKVAHRPPNAHLMAEAAGEPGLVPGGGPHGPGARTGACRPCAGDGSRSGRAGHARRRHRLGPDARKPAHPARRRELGTAGTPWSDGRGRRGQSPLPRPAPEAGRIESRLHREPLAAGLEFPSRKVETAWPITPLGPPASRRHPQDNGPKARPF
jgi:hypothetical protein